MYPLDLAAYILGEGESSRLVRQLKYENPLVLSVAAESNTPFFVRGYFAVAATSRPETWRQAESEIVRQVYRLRDEEVGEAELAKAKKQKAAELVFQHQTVQQQAESLGLSYLATRDPLFDRTYTERIQAVQRRKSARGAKVLRPFAHQPRYHRPARQRPKGVAESGSAGTMYSSSAGEVRLTRLDNGVRVLVRRVPNLPLVNIGVCVLGGSSCDGPKLAGRATLLAAMLDKGIQNGASGAEVAQYFDSVGGVIAFNAGRFTLSGAATCLRKDFPKAAGLFADSFLRPGLPEDQFEKIRGLSMADIANRSADPQAEINELFHQALPAASPYHLDPEGSAETVKVLTVADLKSFHDQCMAPENMVVSVFGDIDPDAGIALVRQHFGGLAANNWKPPQAAADSNVIPESKVVNKVTGKDTAMLMLAFACEGIYDRADHSAMTVLRAILNGYSTPGGWLHNELRGAGLVYYVQSSEMTGPVPGYFVIASQCRPDKLDEVVQRIRHNLDRAKEGTISEEEFQTAIDQIVGLHAQENVTIGQQAGVATIDEIYGLGYDYDKKFDAQIRAVTLNDVVRVAKKYFTKSILVTTSPEKK